MRGGNARRGGRPFDVDDDDAIPSQVQRQTQVRDHRSTVEVLRDARKDTTRTVDVARDTGESLARQGEQIDRMHNKMEKIDVELTVSDKILKTMTGWTGLVTSIFTSTKKADQKKPDAAPKPGAAGPVASSSAAELGAMTGSSSRRGVGGRGGGGARPMQGGAGAQSGEGAVENCGLHEDEIVELDGLASDLEEIKAMAKAQGQAIQRQNERLDALSNRTTEVNSHMERTRNRIDRIT
jgi:hypothetical protein